MRREVAKLIAMRLLSLTFVLVPLPSEVLAVPILYASLNKEAKEGFFFGGACQGDRRSIEQEETDDRIYFGTCPDDSRLDFVLRTSGGPCSQNRGYQTRRWNTSTLPLGIMCCALVAVCLALAQVVLTGVQSHYK